MTESTWRSFPLELAIMSIIERRDGVILSSDLERLLEQEFGEFNKKEIIRTLMDLEIQGKVHVQRIKKNLMRVIRLTEEHRYLAVGED